MSVKDDDPVVSEVTPLTKEEFEFESTFLNLERPFKYEGIPVGVTQEYRKAKRDLFEKHFEIDTDPHFAVSDGIVKTKCRIIDVTKEIKVSKKSDLPFCIFEVCALTSEKKYLFATWKKFNIENNGDWDEIENFERTVVAGNTVELIGYKKNDPEDGWEPFPFLQIRDWNNLRTRKKLKALKNYDGRIDLGIRTQYSPLDGVSSSKDWVEFLAEAKIPVFGCCDLSSVAGFPEMEKAINNHNRSSDFKIKPVYGMTAFVPSMNYSGKKVFHLRFYVKNQAGLKLLYQKITQSYRVQGESPTPKFEWSDVLELKNSKNVFVVMPSVRGELFHVLLRDMMKPWAQIYYSELPKYIDYLEISPPGSHVIDQNDLYDVSGEKVQNASCKNAVGNSLYALARYSLSRKIPAIFSNGPRYVKAMHNVLREAVLYDNKIINMDPSDCFYWEKERVANSLLFLDDEKKQKVFDDVMGQSKTVIEDMVEQVEDVIIVHPDLYLPSIHGMPDAGKVLLRRVKDGIKKYYGDYWKDLVPEKVKDRILFEYNSIKDKYAVVYMSSLLCIEESKRLGYTVGSRGSVGSSVVAFLSGVSEVNPLPAHYRCPNCKYFEFEDANGPYDTQNYKTGWDLPPKDCQSCGSQMLGDGWDIEFSTFMGFKGDKVADIDLNFAGSVQGTIMNYISETIFPGKAYRAGTVLSMQETGQVKTMHRLFGVNKGKNRVFAKETVGMAKTFGKHAGGVVIIPEDMDCEDFCPLSKPPKDKGVRDSSMATHFGFEYLHDTLLKMDILASDSIEFLELLSKFTDRKHETIEPWDQEVLDLFASGKTLGINEFTTITAMEMLDVIVPEDSPLKWQHLCSMSGLHHGTGVWSGNAKEIIKSGKATIENVDGCRDDIVKTLGNAIGDHETAFAIVEKVRKGKGIPKDKVGLVKAADLPEWYFDFMNKIQYMFPKAHAAAYLIISAKQAWYKVHYPGLFYATYLTIQAKYVDSRWCYMELDELEEELDQLKKEAKYSSENVVAKKKKVVACMVLMEAMQEGFRFSTPHYNTSLAETWTCVDNLLVPPLITISHVGAKLAEQIVDERAKNGEFRSMYDFYIRTSVTEASMLVVKDYGIGEWDAILKHQGDEERKRKKNKKDHQKKVYKEQMTEGQLSFLDLFIVKEEDFA